MSSACPNELGCRCVTVLWLPLGIECNRLEHGVGCRNDLRQMLAIALELIDLDIGGLEGLYPQS